MAHARAPSTGAPVSFLNESAADRTIRVIAGAALVAIAVTGPKTPWGYLGLILVVTGLTGFCPIYRILGFSTRGASPPPANATSAPISGGIFDGKRVDVVIDVRSGLEYRTGHLDGAICIPVNVIAEELPKRIDVTPDSRILVYCASGGRSAAAAEQLRALGYRDVTNAGGLREARQHFTAA